MKRHQGLTLILLLSLGFFISILVKAQNDTRPKLTIKRDDKTITVIQNGLSADGARFIPRNKNCKDNFYISTFFAPDPGFVETLINDTRITSAVAFVEDPQTPEGEEKKEKQEVLEQHGGTLDFTDRTRCPDNVQATSTPDVTLEEGRSTVTGTKFLYDNATGIGDMEGPVNLDRIAEGDSPALTATSESAEFNVDEDITIFRDNVKVNSEDRVSEADILELDEDTGIAILRGNPARSTKGTEVVEGDVIEYDIDSNDVVVRGNITASFEFDSGEEQASNSDENPEAAPLDNPDPGLDELGPDPNENL